MNESKNNRIIKLNQAIPDIQQMIKFINLYLDEKIEIDNFGIIYRDKIYEIEKYFKQNNLSIYESLLGKILLEYIDNCYNKCNDIITSMIKKIEVFKTIYTIDVFGDKIINKNIEKYKKYCNRIDDFTIDENLIKIIKKYFLEIEQNQYIDKYEQIEKELETLKMNNLKSELYFKVLPYILKKELLIQKNKKRKVLTRK